MFRNLSTMRICVTGADGFLGRHVAARLSALGCGSLSAARHRDYDLVRMADVERMYDDLKPDVVFHCAAVVGGIEANSRNPGRYFYENLMMGAQLIEGARRARVTKFVQVGTVCSYPKNSPVPFKEDDIWNGYPEETNAPYAIAKKALLVQAQAYREQYALNAICLLLVNLYGPGDNFDPETSHVIPALVKKFSDAQAKDAAFVEVWGTGEATREFLYVEDAAEALVSAAERYDGAAPVNVGAGRDISIRDLADLIREEIGYRGDIVWDRTRPDGQPRRRLDVTKAAELFGFRARTDLRSGLRRTIEWYRSHGAATDRTAE